MNWTRGEVDITVSARCRDKNLNEALREGLDLTTKTVDALVAGPFAIHLPVTPSIEDGPWCWVVSHRKSGGRISNFYGEWGLFDAMRFCERLEDLDWTGDLDKMCARNRDAVKEAVEAIKYQEMEP